MRIGRALTLFFALAPWGCNNAEIVDGDDACGDDCGLTTTSAGATSGHTSTGSLDTGGVGTGSTPDLPPGTCSCLSGNPHTLGCSFEELADWVHGCPVAMPCGRVTVVCMRPGTDLYFCMDQELIYDEAALQCALETLRDSTSARLEIDGREGDSVADGQSIYLVHVLAGGTGVTVGCLDTDTGFDELQERTWQNAGADHFEGCLALASPAARYDCLWEGLVVPVDLPVCE